MNPTPPSDALGATAAYYEENAEAFDQRTRERDMRELYEAFLALLPAGGHILDAGCGPGRDAVAFTQAGYRVTAIDASDAMVRLASRRLGYPALRLAFSELNLAEGFDGVWACASLLHVPRAGMPDVLSRLRRALKPGGVFYASFKRGPGEEFREGRLFNDYEEDALASLFSTAEWKVLRVWSAEEIRPEKRVLWVNVLARKV